MRCADPEKGLVSEAIDLIGGALNFYLRMWDVICPTSEPKRVGADLKTPKIFEWTGGWYRMISGLPFGRWSAIVVDRSGWVTETGCLT